MQPAFKFEELEQAAGGLPKVGYDFPADPAAANGIILVGEAPGAEEARLGHPFVGRSGQLLDKMLAEAGIARNQCLIANVFRYQPPGNKVDTFFISKRAAQQQGIGIAEPFGQFGSAYCRGDFAGEIEHLAATLAAFRRAHPAAIVMALGRTPLWALTGENELLKKVGKPLPCRLAPRLTVIPTYHPSFILRGNWALQPNWLGHFLAAKEFVLQSQ